MKLIINQKSFLRVIQKFLDSSEPREEICEYNVDEYDDEGNLWVYIIFSQEWFNAPDEPGAGMNKVAQCFKMRREVRESLETMFNGISFNVGTYIEPCDK
jgi:hypothetical protein